MSKNIKIKPEATKLHGKIERIANSLFRNYDKVMGKLGLGGRKGDYDDYNYEFIGGAKDNLRKKHYDKSLRLLWKAEEHAPWSSFKDCTKGEQELINLTKGSLSNEEEQELERITSDEFRQFLKDTYTDEQRKATVAILTLIGHGEAYAWMISTELLNEVKSTGGRAALTAQVLEEAKHFVVLRELIKAFDVEIPRLSAWEYLLLERGFKAKGLEKFFAMNILVEGFALSLFGMMGHMPGLKILRLFHLDESRHTALPASYFQEFPMTYWQKNNPIKKWRRFMLIIPALPILVQIEPYLATLGIDTFDFGGSMSRKILNLSYKVGFNMPITKNNFTKLLNKIFNTYCKYARRDHKNKDFLHSETTVGINELKVENDVFKLKGVT